MNEGVFRAAPEESSKSEQDKTKTSTRKEEKSAVKSDGAIKLGGDDIIRLLSRYMSGIATKEEEEIVMDYLSESEENRLAFETMCLAVEYQRHVDMEEADGKRRMMQRRVLWIAISVAAVALICYVIFSVILAG